MNRRFRFLTALLALTGLTALSAESLMAMWCMPGSPVAETMAASAMHDGMHDPGPASSQTESETRTPSHCTLAGSFCAASASLPAAPSVARVPSLVRDLAAIAVFDASPELIIRTLFHPPQA
jgi:hypothetical protein